MHDPVCSAPEAASDLVVSRRGFLIGAAGTGFTLAFACSALAVADPAAAVAQKLFEPTIWYHIDHDGLITVNIIRAEMGQHVGTAVARILADELEADWNNVRIDGVDTDPKWGLMITGASWSVWQSFPLYSRAGAAGRTALVEEGARLLGTPTETCSARSSLVRSGSRSISYAEIVRRGNLSRSYSAEELKKLPIKSAAERRLIGRPVQALDIPAKTNGTGEYGIDAQVDGMVYARPKVPPTRYGSKVVSVDDSAAKRVSGYLRSIVLEDPSGTVPGWVMVCADSFWAAWTAADKVKVEWISDDTAKVSEKDLQEHAAELIANPKGGSLLVDDAGLDAAFASAKTTLERTYTTASALNFQLEPVNALAFEKGGTWEIHTGNQWQSLILPTLAQALGVSQDKVIMRTYLLGGGFGRRLNGDYAVPAALAAKALGKPVKMVCTRPDDTTFGSFRSPSVQRLRIAFDSGGKVIGMDHQACAGWPTQVLAPDLFKTFKGRNGEPYDTFAISGADHWYTVGPQRVRALSNDLANRAFRPGYLRSVGSGWINWALESFMDEAARAVKRDPVEFRLAMLDGAGRNAGSAPDSVGGALRQARVLKRAAEKGGWGTSMPADTGLGVATTFGQERAMPTWTACIARVHVDRKSGEVKLEKLTIVVDAGTVVDPDGALAQVEGSSLWGASLALHEGSEFLNGQPKDKNLDTYTPLRMGDVPEMDIEFIASTEVPVGLGEPCTTVVGPAIGNAIFAAVGARVRHLPIRPAAILQALANA
jgi:isoquinoline 1-oxidoreductase subunit beta